MFFKEESLKNYRWDRVRPILKNQTWKGRRAPLSSPVETFMIYINFNDLYKICYNFLKKYDLVKEGSIKKSIKDIFIDLPNQDRVTITYEMGEVSIKSKNKTILNFELQTEGHVDQDDADKIIDKIKGIK